MNLQVGLRDRRNVKKLAICLSKVCNFQEGTYSFTEETRVEQSIYSQSVIETDRQELDRLYKKHGRIKDPTNMRQALKTPYAKFWTAALLEEWSALKKLGVFELVKRQDVPKGTKILRLLNIPKKKYDQYQNKIERHKVRTCVNGSGQKIDPSQTFAPTVVFHSVMTLLMIACYYDLDIETADIKNFFVRCDMGDEKVYVEQMEGMEERSK